MKIRTDLHKSLLLNEYACESACESHFHVRTQIMQIHANANQDREFKPRLECLMHCGARFRDVARLVIVRLLPQ